MKVYSPMLKVLGSALSNRGGVKSATQTAKDEAQLLSVMNDFWRDALVYASDDGQRAFGRMMQASFNDAPAPVIMRLYADFVLAARRDLGDDASRLTATEVFAPKLTDMFTAESSDVAGFDRGTFQSLADRYDWAVPWAGTLLEHRADEDTGRGHEGVRARPGHPDVQS